MKKTIKTIIILSTLLSTYSYGYECNGRHYCSEMASCEEARWVLNHCPDPRMDGDHDGIPCEQQHCGGYHHSEIGNQNPAIRIFSNKPNTFNYLASAQTPTSTNNNQWTLSNVHMLNVIARYIIQVKKQHNKLIFQLIKLKEGSAEHQYQAVL